MHLLITAVIYVLTHALIDIHRTYSLTSSDIRITLYIGVLPFDESALKSGQGTTIASMASARAAVDVLGLDPTSTTAKCTNKVSLSNAPAQVSHHLLSSSAVLSFCMISFRFRCASYAC